MPIEKWQDYIGDPEFEKQCIVLLKRAAEKMLEKCPIKYRVVRFLKCFDPQAIAASFSISVKMSKKLLNCLIDAKRVREIDADNLKCVYEEFLTNTVGGNPQTILKFKNYDKLKDERIDLLLAYLVKDISAYVKLWQLVKCLLVFSHGQARVKRGFNVNKLMQLNFKERSVGALRIINDQIKKCGKKLSLFIKVSNRSNRKLKRPKKEKMQIKM